jgi:DNA invertase Pin-like site-specific DNA recombinase
MYTANQEPEVRHMCAARGWTIVREYREMESAMSRRPVFDALMVAARKGEFDVVVAWSLDRVARGFQCFDTYRALAAYGVRLVTTREPWTDASGPAQDLLVAVMSFCSGFERQRLVERTKAGLERARRMGHRIGRPPVTGVDLNKAQAMRAAGVPLRLVAQKAGCGETTLRRLLAARVTLAHTDKSAAKNGALEPGIQTPGITSAG